MRNSRVRGILITGKWAPYNLNASKLDSLFQFEPRQLFPFIFFSPLFLFPRVSPSDPLLLPSGLHREIATEHSPRLNIFKKTRGERAPTSLRI